MDRVETEGDAAERAGLSTGSLVSGAVRRTRRPRTVVLVLACATLLAGGFLAQHLTAAPSGTRASVSAAPAATITGRRAFPLHSGGAAADVVVTRAERVPNGATGSALAVFLRLRVSAGVETVTTESFAAADASGAPPVPASDVTVLDPDTRVLPASGGFRIGAPASVDLVVILAVPPGEHLVSILGDAGRTLGGFAVRG